MRKLILLVAIGLLAVVALQAQTTHLNCPKGNCKIIQYNSAPAEDQATPDTDRADRYDRDYPVQIAPIAPPVRRAHPARLKVEQSNKPVAIAGPDYGYITTGVESTRSVWYCDDPRDALVSNGFGSYFCVEQ